MGRPINKRYLGDVAGNIKVSHYFRVGGAETPGDDDTYIVSQRSTNKFLVADTSGAWSEILTLVDKDAGSLAAGEFRISGQDADGNLYNVTRLYNRTLRLGSADDTYVKAAWSIDAPADLPISGVTLVGNDPVVITLASTNGLVEGDVVGFDGVVGTVELNTGTYTVTNIIADTSFELAGTDSANFTAYTSGGVVTGVGDTGSINVQAS